MTLLKDSSRNSAIRTLSVSLWNELQDIDENYAESYLNWCIEKAKTNKLHQQEQNLKKQLKNQSLTEEEKNNLQNLLRNVKHKNHPLNISKGDVVHVRFGINLGDELSDLDSSLKTLDGHYGIVVAQKGFMFLILPLTSHPSRMNDSDLDFYFEGLDLPGGYEKSYLAFAKMKFIHFRRIKRIHGIPNGKKNLLPEQVVKMNKALDKLMALGDNESV
ncbi:MAG: hypothetical protein RR420_08390 [Anaerovoracaceae bacterium]